MQRSKRWQTGGGVRKTIPKSCFVLCCKDGVTPPPQVPLQHCATFSSKGAGVMRWQRLRCELFISFREHHKYRVRIDDAPSVSDFKQCCFAGDAGTVDLSFMQQAASAVCRRPPCDTESPATLPALFLSNGSSPFPARTAISLCWTPDNLLLEYDCQDDVLLRNDFSGCNSPMYNQVNALSFELPSLILM